MSNTKQNHWDIRDLWEDWQATLSAINERSRFKLAEYSVVNLHSQSGSDYQVAFCESHQRRL